MKKTSFALLTLALALQASADVQLVPAGEFVGRDGRPGDGLTWKLPDDKGRLLAARLTASHANVHFNFDYEHQALLSDANGQPAPASGWATQFEWRDSVGLFALNVQWTPRAKKMIDDADHKYISPAILYDTDTGEVLGVLNASLTNIPSLDMTPVAEQRLARLNASFSTTTNPEQSMNPVLLALLKALGLPATDATTDVQAVSAVAALKAAMPAAVNQALGLAETAAEADALSAVASLKTSADSANTAVAALKSGGNPDPSKWVALDKFTELSTQVAGLSASNVDRQVEDLLNAARAEGKCPPVVEAVWRDIGKVNVAQLKALIDKTPGNPALAGLSQTVGKKLDKVDPNAAATAEEVAMCANMGLTLAQFRSGTAAVAV